MSDAIKRAVPRIAPSSAAPAVFVDDGARGVAVPVRAAQEVDEVEAERVFRLPELPLLVASRALEVLTEAPDLIRQGLRRRLARQELADPPHDVRRCRLAGKPVLQDVLGELLQGVLGLAQGASGRAESQG